MLQIATTWQCQLTYFSPLLYSTHAHTPFICFPLFIFYFSPLLHPRICTHSLGLTRVRALYLSVSLSLPPSLSLPSPSLSPPPPTHPPPTPRTAAVAGSRRPPSPQLVLVGFGGRASEWEEPELLLFEVTEPQSLDAG
jgi:hypothetical protein